MNDPIPRNCTAPRCPNPAHRDGLCPTHHRQRQRPRERARNANRATKRKIYASKKWKLLRTRMTEAGTLCSIPRCGQPATDLDHQPPLTEHDPDPYREHTGALVPLCHAHHSEKTASDQGRPGVRGRRRKNPLG